ncbi:cytochrome P450 [Trametes maxima]|nr:cytochrome P450 [Trametes maxima]
MDDLFRSYGTHIVLVVAFVLVCSRRYALNWRRRTRGLPLPPGPRPLPLVGNAFHIPKFKPWQGLRDLCVVYGDVVYLSALGKPMLVIGSSHAATQLLEKRSSISSDRPQSALLPLIGNEVAFSAMPYGQEWRGHRRAFWQIFNPSAIVSYREAQRAAVPKFIRKLHESPQDFKSHTQYMILATVLKVLYGHDAEEADDPLIGKVEVVSSCLDKIATGSHPLDYFPFLAYVPAWVPGAGFHYDLARCKEAVITMKETLFQHMELVMDHEKAACGLKRLLSRIGRADSTREIVAQKEIIKNVGLVSFEAGSDTTYAALSGFFLAISQHPEAQKKAQAELDAVVGRHRLPDYGDRTALVYINAVIKETLRWCVILPLALPHRTIEDDVYNGYFIPAGTMLIPNSWAMLHDPRVYERPDEFRPERFIHDGQLDPTVPDPAVHVFGYGRRVCPGRHFADEMLYLNVASILHVFNIEPPRDECGQTVKIKMTQAHGLTSRPEDCRCVFKPRSEEAVALSVGRPEGVVKRIFL